jgi:hypothetical protein
VLDSPASKLTGASNTPPAVIPFRIKFLLLICHNLKPISKIKKIPASNVWPQALSFGIKSS